MKKTLDGLLASKGREVYSIGPEATVLEAVRTMNAEKIGALLICDGGEVLGIFTERDVLTRVLDSELDPAVTRVSEVMSSEIITVGPSMNVEEAMAVVTEKRCRHLPVLDDGKLVGLVSIGDLTRWVSRHQQGHIQDLVNYITSKYPV